MISADFEYYRVQSITEAVDLHVRLTGEGKSPQFYNGGTEIITMMRLNEIYVGTKTIIDIKSIPECTVFGFDEDTLVIGSSVSLADIEERSTFPFLAKNCSRIADHTSREKITIGGNICGTIKYKEAILPLLLTDCNLVIADKAGLHEVAIQEVFDEYIRLDPGALIIQLKIKKRFLDMPFVNKKMTKIDRIGYPLLTVAGIQTEKGIRFAFTGLCEHPFQSVEMDEALNQQKDMAQNISDAIERIPSQILDDMDGSDAYRTFVLQNVLEESVLELKGVVG